MTLIRLKDGSLIVHGAIQMSPADLGALDRLGKVATIVVPNAFHDSEAPSYAARYPDAKVYVPAGARAKCSKKMTVSGTLEEDWPHGNEVACISLAPSFFHESVFVHRVSKTLIVTDLAFNLRPEDFKNPFERYVMGRWNRLFDGLGPSRLTKLIVRNRKTVSAFLEKVAAQDFDRVIMNHGRIVDTDGKRQFLAGYERVYGKFLV